MIRNIIFDMGNVLLVFDPEMFMDSVHITDPEDRELIKKTVYQSLEWARMDRGSLSVEMACEMMCGNLPERLWSFVHQLTVDGIRPIVPVEGIVEIVKELKENGYRLFLLSNASECHSKYWQQFQCSEFFDGVVVSAYEKLVKPQPEIYRLLLSRYDLRASECVFVDDSILNIEGAFNEGISGIVFHGDAQELREKLRSLGVRIC